MKTQILIFLVYIFYYVRCQDCEHFAEIDAGEIFYTPEDNSISVPNGAKAILRCHASKFETASTCIDGNWQPPSLGYCKAELAVAKRQEHSTRKPTANAKCPSLEAPSHSFLTYSPLALAPYPSGTMASLNCFLGFSPIGQTAAECKDGEWSSIGNCQPVSVQRCPPIAPIPHGMINYIPGGNGPYDYGSIAELTCGLGRSVAGNNRVTCESNGWAPTPGLGHCQEGVGTSGGIGCTTLAAMNGQVSYVQSNPSIPYSSGSTALLICNAGFTPSGSASSYCSNGMWSPPLGSCLQGGGGGLGGIGTLGGLGTMNTGHFGGLGGTNGQQCFAIGAFVMNGQVTYSSGNSFGPFPTGSSATVMCNPGYMVSGSASAFCQNGQWNPPTLGTCNQNGVGGGLGGTGGWGSTGVCFAIAMPLNGQIQYSSGQQTTGQYQSGTSATLYCNSGTVSGSSVSQCSNGMWYPPIGSCNSFGGGIGGIGGGTGQCTMGLFPPLGATIQYSSGSTFGPWPQGSTATLMCQGGTPLGQSTSQCSNGQWQPSTFTGCSNTGGGLGGIGGIGGTQCYTAMPQVSGGQITYSSGSTFGPFNSGTMATLMCTNGQMAQGQTTASCSNGMWNPPMFTGCGGTGGIGGIGGIGTGVQCYTAMPTVVGGQVTYSSGSTFGPFNSGTIATLMCTNGQFPQGQTTASCSNGMWNPSMFTGCGGSGGLGGTGGLGGIGTQCMATLFAPLNGQIRYSTGSTFGPFQSGTTATLACNQGYSPQGSSSATCLNGQFNPPSLGQCVMGGIGGGIGGIGTGVATAAAAETPTSKEKTAANCDDSPLPLLSNGRLEISNGDPTKAQIVCHQGFSSHVAEISIFCQNGEVRTRQSASCIPTTQNPSASGAASSCKLPVLHVERGQILYSSGSTRAPFPSGTIATLVCEFGNQPIGGATMATCVEGGWAQQLATCQPPSRISNSQCHSLAQITGGHIAYSEIFNPHGPFNDGTFATLMCDFGRTLVGPATATCRNGTWDPKIGICQNPAELPTSGGGSFQLPQALNPPPTARCPPIRSPSLKSTLEFDQTPLADGNYPNSTIAHIICLEDNTEIENGVSEAECIKGIWLPKLGECIVKKEREGDGENEIEREEKTQFRGPGNCQPIEAPPKGRISYIQSGAKNSFQTGSTAILSCNIGYSVAGHAALSCAPGGAWLPAGGFGKCISNTDLVH